MDYEFNIKNPLFINLGYMVAVANIQDKHDRSAPSDHHWKILKCRMLIFSNYSILACPDKQEVKKVHIIFNKMSDDYDKLNSLFIKYSLSQEGALREVTPDIFQICFQYTMTAKLAPVWNTLGMDYLVNNRNFLTTKGPLEGIKYQVVANDQKTTLKLQPVKINLTRSNNDYLPGEYIRVLPSLNRAVLEESCGCIPKQEHFKSYRDLRRHWKNIHGYRLPETESSSYCLVKFWRGESLTYPKLCVTRTFPIVAPMPKPDERPVLMRFMSCLKNKMASILGSPITIQHNFMAQLIDETLSETQSISLCTPTQPHYNVNDSTLPKSTLKKY